MNTIFSEKEQNIRKWWLRIFLFICLYSCFMFVRTPMNHVPSGYIGFAIDLLLFKFAIYYFGYRKMGTRWLTAMIWLSCMGLLFLSSFFIAAAVSNNVIAHAVVDSFCATTAHIGIVLSVISHLTGLTFLYANIRLRKINKTHKSPQITIISA